MASTIVLQSHRSPLPHDWLEPCLQSVREWARSKNFNYLFINDELFDEIPSDQLHRIDTQTVIASDLARLLKLKRLLQDHDTAIWCDADFLVFDPDRFNLVDDACALGREVWIQAQGNDRLKAYTKVHNAFLMFRRGNHFLDFYIETALKLLRRSGDNIPPQFIGPKLLTALHNIAQLPVQEDAGMMSPLVVHDIVYGGGTALDLFNARCKRPPSAVNLCESSSRKGLISASEINSVIALLLQGKGEVFNVSAESAPAERA